MRQIFFLFMILSNFLIATENMTVETNLSKSLSTEISHMKNSKFFLDYSLSVLKIKKIYKLLKDRENCKEVLGENPLPSSEIAFQKLGLNKYNLLEKWEKEVFQLQPKNMSNENIKKIKKTILQVREKFKPILDEVYERSKNVLINSSEKNINLYKSYIKEIIKQKEINNKTESIVIILSKMIVPSPDIYVNTYHEHKGLEQKYKTLKKN